MRSYFDTGDGAGGTLPRCRGCFYSKSREKLANFLKQTKLHKFSLTLSKIGLEFVIFHKFFKLNFEKVSSARNDKGSRNTRGDTWLCVVPSGKISPSLKDRVNF